jgi:hypothetical protein
MKTLYFESHVTIEPIFDEQLKIAEEIAKKYNFKIANLLMQKREEDSPERSKYDTFLTGHSQDQYELSIRTIQVITELKSSNFKVWRYKIESAIIDSRIEDEFNLLGN